MEALVCEEAQRKIDALEAAICEHPGIVELIPEHVITPGLYRRTLRAPVDTIATTYIHAVEHQFVVTRGTVVVWNGESPEGVEVTAPYFGITKPGTRRVCLVLEDAEWTTYHPIPEGMTSIDEIEAYIFEYRTLPDGTNMKTRFQEALAAKKLKA